MAETLDAAVSSTTWQGLIGGMKLPKVLARWLSQIRHRKMAEPLDAVVSPKMSEPLDAVVSLTTWQGRIDGMELPRVLARWLSQRTAFRYKVVLVLSEAEFGPNYKLPDTISTIRNNSPRFEILWTKKNTRALKKLNPTMSRYPDIPIITTDDDIVVSPYTVDALVKLHKSQPSKILGHWLLSTAGVNLVAGIRLFPPHSLAEWPDEWFGEYFNNLHDDEWNGLRAMAKGTGLFKIPVNVIENMDYGDERIAFHNEYSRFNYAKALSRFMQEHPELGLNVVLPSSRASA